MSNLSTGSELNSINPIIKAFAEKYDLPFIGVTIMGDKPYVNAAGLMHKAKNIGLKNVKIDIQKAATKEDPSAIVKATVKLKDGSEYEDYGFGSKESIKMSTLHNNDFITMTTITRAKNRALRSATGFGLVSAEEVADADKLYSQASVEIEGSKLATLQTPEEAPKAVVQVKLEPKEEDIEKPIKTETKVELGELVKKGQTTLEDFNEVFGEQLNEITQDSLKGKLIKALENNKDYPVQKMLDAFYAEDIDKLTDSQLLICIQAVEKNKSF